MRYCRNFFIEVLVINKDLLRRVFPSDRDVISRFEIICNINTSKERYLDYHESKH